MSSDSLHRSCACTYITDIVNAISSCSDSDSIDFSSLGQTAVVYCGYVTVLFCGTADFGIHSSTFNPSISLSLKPWNSLPNSLPAPVVNLSCVYFVLGCINSWYEANF